MSQGRPEPESERIRTKSSAALPLSRGFVGDVRPLVTAMFDEGAGGLDCNSDTSRNGFVETGRSKLRPNGGLVDAGTAFVGEAARLRKGLLEERGEGPRSVKGIKGVNIVTQIESGSKDKEGVPKGIVLQQWNALKRLATEETHRAYIAVGIGQQEVLTWSRGVCERHRDDVLLSGYPYPGASAVGAVPITRKLTPPASVS